MNGCVDSRLRCAHGAPARAGRAGMHFHIVLRLSPLTGPADDGHRHTYGRRYGASRGPAVPLPPVDRPFRGVGGSR